MSRYEDTHIDDGMRHSGLVPSRQELREERLEERIRELEARGNALCSRCNQPHFTLLKDKTCLLCEARDEAAEAEMRCEDLEREVERLREAIERAGHAAKCPVYWMPPRPCACWKRVALEKADD